MGVKGKLRGHFNTHIGDIFRKGDVPASKSDISDVGRTELV